MASGTSTAEEEQIERPKSRWSQNSKVYTRKLHKANKNNDIKDRPKSPPTSSASVTATVKNQTNENNNVNTGNNNNTYCDHIANGRATHEKDKQGEDIPLKDNEKEKQKQDILLKENKKEKEKKKQTEDIPLKENEKEDVPLKENETEVVPQNDVEIEDILQKENEKEDVEIEDIPQKENEKEDVEIDDIPQKDHEKEDLPQKSSASPTVHVEEANSSQPQLLSTHLETASEDSSILNRTEAPVPNGHDANLGNGSMRPIVTRVDDRVNISVASAQSKDVVRDLKRKLVEELSQVRKMAKILRDKEIEISVYSGSGIDVGVAGVDGGSTAPAVSGLQFPVSGQVEKGMGEGGRRNTDVSPNGSRLFRQLSVSVMENSHGSGSIIEKEKRTPKANQYYRNSDFILGKEKLPPAESNKKTKSSSKKHGSRGHDYGFGIDKQIFKKCINLLQKLMKHKHGWVFNSPVDVKQLGLHDYFDIIKHPMDLGTVKTRLTENWYKTPREFAEDVRLTFHNAMTYNPEGQDVHFMAKELLTIFEDRWPAIETEYDRKLRFDMIRDFGVPTPTSRKSSATSHAPAPIPFPPPPLLHHPPSFQGGRHFGRSQSMPVPPESRSMPTYVGRTPAPKKPKAKDPDKRDMTFEEKQKLSTNLQGLPPEKLDVIVQIIKKRNTALSQHDDEIEVDIDNVDTETLWELDRFVTNYKKNLSKHKRKAELAQARALAAQAAQETIPAPGNMEAKKETRAGETNGANSPHVQQEKHSDNGSGSSSSSSSSSDSGSSSSDSDSSSSSSSSSGSDEEQ